MLATSRRIVLCGGLLTAIIGDCGAPCNAQGSSHPEPCGIPPDRVASFFNTATAAPVISAAGAYQIEPRSGNSALDYALAQSLGMISRMFDVLPGFTYYNDAGAPNARATAEPMLERTDGTVLFGLQFLQDLLGMGANGDAGVVAFVAHEFGHIVSYKHGLIGQLVQNGAFRGEQYADYISGFFAGKRKLEKPDFPAVAFATSIRAYAGPVRGTHGTGAERGSAVQAGFIDAHSRGMTPAQAVNAAFNYAMSRS